ncbi:hypothetical protein ACFYPZ_30335 [Streptomyces sp. NPDC005506]|uniref:hypothetical protein n=1 Tax=unclassified Streptomyces TaxID=2593676 RepID=UPI0036C4332C
MNFSLFGMPKAVSEAEAARDKAYDALGDAELKYADVSDDQWQARAHQRDAQAAKAATLAGKPLPAGPSHYERAANLRGEAMGVLEVLRTRARQADNAIALAWQQEAPGMADDIRAAYVAAEKAEAEAEQALRSARGMMRSAAFALVGTKYVNSGKPFPRLDGNPPGDMSLSEMFRRFVASHDMTIDTDSPEYRAVVVDGLTRLVRTDFAEQLERAEVGRIVPIRTEGGNAK